MLQRKRSITYYLISTALSALLLPACGGGSDGDPIELGSMGQQAAIPQPADTSQSAPAVVSANPQPAGPSQSTPTAVSRKAVLPVAPTISSLSAETPFSQMGGNAQVVGTTPSFKNMSEPGVYGSGTVLGNALRFGKVSDPRGSGRRVFRHAMKMPDDPTTACCHRVDLMPPNNDIDKETVYWIAYDMLIPAHTYFANDDTALSSIHVGGAGSGNWGLQLNKGKLRAVKSVEGQRNTYWQLDAAGPLTDQWLKVVVKFRLSAGSTGMLQVWINGKQMVNDTGPNSPSYGGDYAKVGFYNYSFVNGWGDYSRPEREMFYGSHHIVRDAGYTYEQVAALLN